MDVEFCLQQGHADLHIRLRIGAELDADQIGLEKLEVREFEELLRPLIVAQNEACDREVDRIDDRQRDHAQIVPFDVPQQLMQRADAVLHEDAELPQAGPIAAAGGPRFGLRLPAVAHRRSPWLIKMRNRRWSDTRTWSYAIGGSRRNCRVALPQAAGACKGSRSN